MRRRRLLGWACLGKYAGVLLIPVVGLYLLSVPEQRRWLKRPEPYAALVIVAIMLLPVIVWNARHDWASLAFQSTRRLGEMGGFKPRFVALLVTTQLLLLTPLSVLAGPGCSVASKACLGDAADRTSTLAVAPERPCPPAGLSRGELRTNAKNNWLIPARWSLVILGMHHAQATPGNNRWRIAGLASSALLLVAAIGVFAFPNLPLPGDLNIWSGWRTAAQQVDQQVAAERAEGRRAFVFSPNYKISSLLWFHRPSQERTYAQDIFGRPALQYDYFPRIEDLTGATGFLVLSDQSQSALDVNAVRPLFETLERVNVVEAGALGRITRRIEIWRGGGYRGSLPPDPDRTRQSSP